MTSVILQIALLLVSLHKMLKALKCQYMCMHVLMCVCVCVCGGGGCMCMCVLSTWPGLYDIKNGAKYNLLLSLHATVLNYKGTLCVRTRTLLTVYLGDVSSQSHYHLSKIPVAQKSTCPKFHQNIFIKLWATVWVRQLTRAILCS